MSRRTSAERSSEDNVIRPSETSKAPAPSSNRRMNWRCVACTAASGMLLTSSTRRRRLRSPTTPRRSRRSRKLPTPASGDGLISVTGMALLRRELGGRRDRNRQRLIDIFQNVLDMLDANREPDRFRRHSGGVLLLRRHLAMRGRGGMTAQCAGVADIDDALDELQRIVEALGRRMAAADAESEQRRRPPAEIFVGERVIAMILEARIFDPGDARVLAQREGDAPRVGDMALDAQRNRLYAL